MAKTQNLTHVRIDTKALRERLGMTQQEFADALRVARTTVLNWETRGNQPSAPVLPGLAKLVGCSIEDLYEGTDE
jgi:DNA-binding XRE family transcriptional regulator